MNSCAIPAEIEPIPPNIRNDIVSESGLTYRTSQLEKFLMKPHESSRIRKNEFVAIWAIRGLCGMGVHVFLKPQLHSHDSGYDSPLFILI